MKFTNVWLEEKQIVQYSNPKKIPKSVWGMVVRWCLPHISISLQLFDPRGFPTFHQEERVPKPLQLGIRGLWLYRSPFIDVISWPWRNKLGGVNDLRWSEMIWAFPAFLIATLKVIVLRKESESSSDVDGLKNGFWWILGIFLGLLYYLGVHTKYLYDYSHWWLIIFPARWQDVGARTERCSWGGQAAKTRVISAR